VYEETLTGRPHNTSVQKATSEMKMWMQFNVMPRTKHVDHNRQALEQVYCASCFYYCYFSNFCSQRIISEHKLKLKCFGSCPGSYLSLENSHEERLSWNAAQWQTSVERDTTWPLCVDVPLHTSYALFEIMLICSRVHAHVIGPTEASSVPRFSRAIAWLKIIKNI